MEKYFNQYAIGLAVSLLGCTSYVIVAAVRYGFQNVSEKDVVMIFADFIAICSAVKIICLSFDATICPSESRGDMIFLGLGGVMMLLASSKNIASKFKQPGLPK